MAMAAVCRLRNNVDDVVRELLKGKPQLQPPGRLMPVASLIVFPCCEQAVRSTEPRTDPCHDTLPGADRRAVPAECSCVHRRCCSLRILRPGRVLLVGTSDMAQLVKLVLKGSTDVMAGLEDKSALLTPVG